MLSLEDKIVIALRRTTQAIDVWSRELLQGYGLTSPQLATLREIQGGKNNTTGTLAAALHLSQPTVTGILGRLEQRGLITRVRSLTDRRSVTALVTETGRQLADNAPQLLRDRFCQELRKLPKSDQLQVLAVLEHVAGMMQAPHLDELPYFFREANDGEDGNGACDKDTNEAGDRPTNDLGDRHTNDLGDQDAPASAVRPAE